LILVKPTIFWNFEVIEMVTRVKEHTAGCKCPTCRRRRARQYTRQVAATRPSIDLQESEGFWSGVWDYLTGQQGQVDRDSKAYIQWVQRSLNKILGSGLAVDGVRGQKTRSAIRDFQRKYGLAVDGDVGPDTEKVLIKAGAGNPPASKAPSYPPNRPPASTSPGGFAFITINPGVLTNPEINKVLRQLDGYFKKANLSVTLTSGIRTPQKQLDIIRNAAVRRGIDAKYPAIRTATVDDIESWLGTWDELLNRKKFIVNPPKPVTSRISGRRIDISPHMKGRAFDLSGADLDRIASVVQSYCRDNGGISQILIETVNNAVHIGIGSTGTCQKQKK
jgi:peptidoglycan hydrolase-like protein with peptidoglycan-binding domain